MIRSIQSIEQIGTFTNFPNGGKYRFDKLTFIFGLNSYGKSTVCDIFKSLATNNTTILERRRSIPLSTARQSVKISIEEVSGKEKLLEFKNTKWDSCDIAEDIEVFDANFIHENVFTGLTFERNNKENFTNFILGADSVKAAEQVTSIRKKVADLRKELKGIVPSYVKDKSDAEIKAFIDMKIEENVEDIKQSLFDKKKMLNTLEENKKNIDNIILMKEPSVLLVDSNQEFRDSIFFIYNALYKGYDSFNEVSASILNKHLERMKLESNQVKDWLKQGLSMIIKDEEGNDFCPFCGQNMENIRVLINAYKTYFNEEYNYFINDISCTIDKCFQNIVEVKFDYSREIASYINIIKNYKDLIVDFDFSDNISIMDDLLSDIIEYEKEFSELLKQMRQELEKLISVKKIAPFSKIICNFDSKGILSCLEKYERLVNIFKNLLNTIICHVKKFKTDCRSGKIDIEIGELKSGVVALEAILYRCEQELQCSNYLDMQNEIMILSQSEKILSEELESSQLKYLNKYFETINKLFKKLGSGDYLIERVNPDNRGYKKVYGIRVKYKGSPIKDIDLQYVFSESDRRALAMSIFWAKIALKENELLAKTIIVLDDPVTSFDDNRVSYSVKLVDEALIKVKQAIILTHYPNLIKRFCEVCKNISYVFLKIDKNATSSYLQICEDNEFILNEHQKAFLNIYDFVNRKSSNDIRKDLRPFMEEHIRIVFIKAINEYNMSKYMLKELINGLTQNGIIEEQVGRTLHKFRTELNPEEHVFTTRNIEDVRVDASNLLDFLYSVKLETNLTF